MGFMTIEELKNCLRPLDSSLQKRIAEYKEYIRKEQLKRTKKKQLLKLIANFKNSLDRDVPLP